MEFLKSREKKNFICFLRPRQEPSGTVTPAKCTALRGHSGQLFPRVKWEQWGADFSPSCHGVAGMGARDIFYWTLVRHCPKPVCFCPLYFCRTPENTTGCFQLLPVCQFSVSPWPGVLTPLQLLQLPLWLLTDVEWSAFLYCSWDTLVYSYSLQVHNPRSVAPLIQTSGKPENGRRTITQWFQTQGTPFIGFLCGLSL